ncbi:hypothetical protein LLG90_25715 [Aromatoleum toluclasticum]|uniref:hypothetical protein n=1 Tax=Aromatoleum toluclasticum TaxID=92003 RepID=UPI001D18C4B5|nr:hypothetical protein [Aromatoleum toluclasticum]MCC4118756.1 hypothetical protein [Aromatoleum toluclasticum]
MRTALRTFALVLWVLVGTTLLSRWWYANPEHFPRFPESFWRYLDHLFGAANVDDAQNVEFFVVVVAAFLIVVAVTAIAFAVVKYAKQQP